MPPNAASPSKKSPARQPGKSKACRDVSRDVSKVTNGTSGRVHGGLGKASSLQAATVSDIRRELRRRLTDMERRRDALASELDALESAIAAFEEESGLSARPRPGGRTGGDGSTRRNGTRRHRNAVRLVDAMQSVLQDSTLSVSELASVVQEAGYRTTSPNFRTIVNQTLINNPSLFKRVSRGRYTVV